MKQKRWVNLCRFLARWILRIFVGPLRVTGDYPSSGAFVLVSNHRSEGDPPVLQIACDRHIRFIAKSALFERRFIGWFLRSIGAVPVNQFSADITAVRTAIALLRQGEVVGIFPEGKVNRGATAESLLPLTKGAAMVARKAGVPIIVCVVKGTDIVWPKASLWPRHKHAVEVVFGEELWSIKSSDEEVTAAIERDMRRLLNNVGA